MCGKYGMQQGQAEQGASADGAASEESARLSSHNKQQSPPPAAASHPHGASGGSPPTEDEATSSLSHRVSHAPESSFPHASPLCIPLAVDLGMLGKVDNCRAS